MTSPRQIWRIMSLALYIVLLCFWIAKAGQCVHGLIGHGLRGITDALSRGVPSPSGSPTGVGIPDWYRIERVYIAAALLTVLLAIDNRGLFRRRSGV